MRSLLTTLLVILASFTLCQGKPFAPFAHDLAHPMLEAAIPFHEILAHVMAIVSTSAATKTGSQVPHSSSTIIGTCQAPLEQSHTGSVKPGTTIIHDGALTSTSGTTLTTPSSFRPAYISSHASHIIHSTHSSHSAHTIHSLHSIHSNHTSHSVHSTHPPHTVHLTRTITHTYTWSYSHVVLTTDHSQSSHSSSTIHRGILNTSKPETKSTTASIASSYYTSSSTSFYNLSSSQTAKSAAGTAYSNTFGSSDLRTSQSSSQSHNLSFSQFFVPASTTTFILAQSARMGSSSSYTSSQSHSTNSATGYSDFVISMRTSHRTNPVSWNTSKFPPVSTFSHAVEATTTVKSTLHLTSTIVAKLPHRAPMPSRL